MKQKQENCWNNEEAITASKRFQSWVRANLEKYQDIIQPQNVASVDDNEGCYSHHPLVLCNTKCREMSNGQRTTCASSPTVTECYFSITLLVSWTLRPNFLHVSVVITSHCCLKSCTSDVTELTIIYYRTKENSESLHHSSNEIRRHSSFKWEDDVNHRWWMKCNCSDNLSFLVPWFMNVSAVLD